MDGDFKKTGTGMGKNEKWGKVKNRGMVKKFQNYAPKNARKHTKEPLFTKIDLFRS